MNIIILNYVEILINKIRMNDRVISVKLTLLCILCSNLISLFDRNKQEKQNKKISEIIL